MRRAEGKGGIPATLAMGSPPDPVASSNAVAQALLRSLEIDTKLLEADGVGRVANELVRQWYAGKVTRLACHASSSRCYWHLGPMSDEEIEALNERDGPRRRFCTYYRVPDEHAEKDADALVAVARCTEKMDGWVFGRDVIEAFAADKRPRNPATLGSMFVRNERRGLLKWRYQPGRESGTKQWTLTDAGIEAVDSRDV